ncbi:endonuclease III [Candidatus Sumerlaeota bacterium]|nr:endonuclease III [Candidatus Sumerlaeota bacterium]
MAKAKATSSTAPLRTGDATPLRRALAKAFPDADCALDWKTPLQLLIATILSAQCTDARVNQVTPALFERYPTARAFAEADMDELREMIRSTGFFNNKAKAIQAACSQIVDEFGGEVPDSMEQLLKLRGVARKTANVVLGTAFGKNEGIVVDTHVIRLAHRMGLSAQRDADKIERDLMEQIPRQEWTAFAHRMVLHGRKWCTARRPDCETCPCRPACPQNGV